MHVGHQNHHDHEQTQEYYGPLLSSHNKVFYALEAISTKNGSKLTNEYPFFLPLSLFLKSIQNALLHSSRKSSPNIMDLFKGSCFLCCGIVPPENEVSTAQYPCRLTVRDQHSAQLEIGEVNDTCVILILDVLARIVRNISNDDTEERFYSYDRQGQNIVLMFRTLIPPDTNTPTTALETFRGLEYGFSQYTIFRVLTPSSGGTTDDGRINQVHEDSTQPNFVARGLELSGLALRNGLKSGGKATGSAIRTLGNKYTDYFGKTSPVSVPPPPSLSSPTTTAGTINHSTTHPHESKTAQLASAVATAEKHQARCENVHAGARTLTSAALFPVRFIGTYNLSTRLLNTYTLSTSINPPSQHPLPTPLLHTPSPHPFSTPPLHTPSPPPLSTPLLHTPSPHPLSTHPLNTPSQHPLSTPPLHTPSPSPLSTPLLHTPSQHPFSTPPLNTPSPHPSPQANTPPSLLLNIKTNPKARQRRQPNPNLIRTNSPCRGLTKYNPLSVT